MRCVRKYNINKEKNTYNLYVRTGKVKTYLLVKVTSKGKLLGFQEIKPEIKIGESEKQSWNTLFSEIKYYQFNKVFPKGTTRKEELLFLYCTSEANRIIKYEDWLCKQKCFPKDVAWRIYQEIGEFKKIKIIQRTADRIIAKIENKWIVSINLNCNKYYIYHNKDDKYSKRIKQISNELNISIEFAAIIRFFNKKEAYEILERMINLSSNKVLMDYINAYVKYMKENKSDLVRIEEKEIKKVLEKEFGVKTFRNMEIPRENLLSWANYLINS